MRILLLLLISLMPATASGRSYPLPPQEFSLIGSITYVEALAEDTLLDIAKRQDVGQDAIVLANPDVDRWLPGAGTKVTIPSRHILPAKPYTGLVLNLPEMRLYYFPEPDPSERARVLTYPVSIGRMDWSTPLGLTRLVSKEQDPSWRPPESIRQEHEADGDPLPRVVPPGPDNPLGRHALRLGLPGYLLHGTNKVFGVGMRVSHGCIRMLPEDIEELFALAPVGTPVRIINQPVKLGWHGGDLFLEVHPPLEEDQMDEDSLSRTVMAAIDEELFKRPFELDQRAVGEAIRLRNGMPMAISLPP